MSEATHTRNIIVDFPDWAGSTVYFYLRTYFAAAGVEGFPKKEYALLLNGTGQGAQALPVPDNTGDVAWGWRVKTPDNNNYGGDDSPLTLAYGADLQLTSWLAAAQSGETPASLDDYFVLKTGDTMTGPLDFSGTDHAGVSPIHLTTAERDALTPAEGMFIYNETDSVFQAYQGGAWVDYGSGGGAVSSVFGLTGDVGLEDLSPGTPSAISGDKILFYKPGTGHLVIQFDTFFGPILYAYRGLTGAANKLIYLTGAATAAMVDLSAFIRTLLPAADAATARGTLGAAALGANTFTGTQNLADNLLTGAILRDTAEAVNALGNVSGTMTIDYTAGQYVGATLTGNVTTLTINNWPASGVGSFTLELAPGGFTVDWGVTWVGDEPVLGSTVEFVVIWSRDGGTTKYAAHVGATA